MKCMHEGSKSAKNAKSKDVINYIFFLSKKAGTKKVACTNCLWPGVPDVVENSRHNYPHLCTVCLAMYDAAVRLAIRERMAKLLRTVGGL